MNTALLFALAGIMERHPEAIDDDLRLYELYLTEYEKCNPKVYSFGYISERVREGEFASFNTVVRYRREIQADRPDLRGLRWDRYHPDTVLPNQIPIPFEENQ